MTPRAPQNRLVAIIGATGTGKSDLAVDIARRYNGEIINGDAMQLYQGLPIITNKISHQEMRGVPHHLLGCIGLEEETWTVGKFVQKALSVIDEIRSRQKLPILVGGTHYYTQSLLFEDALADAPSQNENNGVQDLSILDGPTDAILEKLMEVDPVMADRWHPKDRRKIQRSLEIYLKTGKQASQIYDEQRIKQDVAPENGTPGSNQPVQHGFRPRFPTLVLWVHAPKDVLYPRLDNRVMKMLDQGLLSEVESLNTFRMTSDASTGSPVDQSRGIWVSIGYKEFKYYHSALIEGTISKVELEKLRTAAIESTQAATRQYANRQIRWIRIKFLNALYGAGQRGNTFLLDGSDLSKWEERVLWPATEVTNHFLSDHFLPDPRTLSTVASEMLAPKRDYDLSQRPELWKKRVCELCGTIAATENDWNLHVKSRRHRRAVGTKKHQENHIAERRDDPESLRMEPTGESVDILESHMDLISEQSSPK
ncbi:IPP transferase-domain-containing protein [Clohesyomyces aquaticus]|uniref:tRNA dimethylallyltransferase n=1 Tax=Clohesyomyces aquaticus TaxID=1231657 RepID=A0A1Y1YUW4_9PLEO|nr:IPP transferase-domain-containing protein [Clohesyomyces aquaticus]